MTTPRPASALDEADVRILAALQQDASIANQDLAALVHLSPAPCLRRVRRLREQGTVLLRLTVDAQGLPQNVALHRSSGHPRLDEQAVQAMRAARFKPRIEHGQAIEWSALAPLVYELD